MKYVCKDDWIKCHNSSEFYQVYNGFEFSRNICTNDKHFYQACDNTFSGMKITNDEILCGNYLCKSKETRYKFIGSTAYIEKEDKVCNGQSDCINTDLDETNCFKLNFTELPSGESVLSSLVCDKKCDIYSCEDEANCNGLTYGIYCNVEYIYDSKYYYRQPSAVCRGTDSNQFRLSCTNGEDIKNCTVTDDTEYACKHSFAKEGSTTLVPILNFTRCAAFFPGKKRYCKGTAFDQTNCTDTERVGLSCEVNGYPSTLSIFMICNENKTKHAMTTLKTSV